jgi:hypothetical protein
MPNQVFELHPSDYLPYVFESPVAFGAVVSPGCAIADCAFQPGPAFGLGEILPDGFPDILGGAKVLSVNDVFGIGSMVIDAVGFPFFTGATAFPGLLKPDKAVPKF